MAFALALTCACGKQPVAATEADAANPSSSAVAVAGPATVPPAMVEAPASIPATPAEAKEAGRPDEIPGAPAATTLPAGFADLTKTVRLEVKDEWGGLGGAHVLVAALERSPGARAFTVSARVQRTDYPPLKETVRDPTAPRPSWEVDWEKEDHCTIRNMDTGKCEDPKQPPEYKTKKATVDAASVEAFLAEIAKRSIDPDQQEIPGMWTDDYPAGHVTVWIPGVKDPIHLAFRDQRRHWRVNGAFLTLDPGSERPAAISEPVHARINERYQRVLKNMGAEKWSEEINRPRGR